MKIPTYPDSCDCSWRHFIRPSRDAIPVGGVGGPGGAKKARMIIVRLTGM